MRSTAGVAGPIVAAALVAGCTAPVAGELTVVAPEARRVTAAPSARTGAPSGTITVAYPDEPGRWYPEVGWDVAAVDLAHLWGLPLYHYDEHGQLVPALARSATTQLAADGAFSVEIALAPGRWSDGAPVTAADVVATIEALREGPLARELSVVEEATAVDDHTVRLTFDRPYARWPHLLAGGRSVLPAHVLERDGSSAYHDGVPVSGGPFRLVEREPGLRVRFEAHADGPLGPPATATIEVLVVPRFDTALGLLEDGEVDVMLGHLALDPAVRTAPLERVTVAAPTGGTWIGVSWWPSGALGDDEAGRRTVAGSVVLDELAEGLLDDPGSVATSVLPGVEGPPPGTGTGNLSSLDGVVDVPRWHELPGLAARALSRAVAARGGRLALVSSPVAELVAEPSRRHDGSVLIVRDGPRPSLSSWGPGAPDRADPRLLAADAATSLRSEAMVAALSLLADDAAVLPLLRVAPAHVWRDDVTGVTPSSWPGLALWDVDSWSRSSRS